MKFLAVDVGGSSTRATIVAADGTCVGYGRAGSGNPTSSSATDSVAAIAAATHAAAAGAGTTPAALTAGVLGIAGAAGDTSAPLRAELIRAGLPELLTFESDLLVAYYSGSLAAEGYALVAGTGAAAVRVRGGQIEATCDGLGWLLGDGGSGFWIGHRALLAVTNALDDRGPPTALVDLVLAELDIERTSGRGRGGRLTALRQVVDKVYSMRPVELARFAPLAFEAEALDDEIARRVVADAADALVATVGAVVVPDISGPLVLSGSILSRQRAVAEVVASSFRPEDDRHVTTVADGLAGAAVLALRHGGVDVDDAVFARIQASLADRR